MVYIRKLGRRGHLESLGVHGRMDNVDRVGSFVFFQDRDQFDSSEHGKETLIP
jgi:hypothetical protein